MLSDKVEAGFDTGVDSRHVLGAAADAPGGDAGQRVDSVIWTGQWAAAVPPA